jgi:hypothetical protein
MAADIIALAPAAAGLCPLWEVNGESIVGMLPSGAFVRIYYEDLGEGDAAIQHVAADYHGFVTELLTHVAEVGMWDWFERTAAALAYPDAAELRSKLDAEE